MCHFAVYAALIGLTGCANIIASPYSSDYEALDHLKASKPGKVQVAQVKPIDPAATVNRISLRGVTLVASPNGTFSEYLQQALVRDLREIGAFDAASEISIEATVLTNDIDVRGFSIGTGVMNVDLVVARNNIQRLKKIYQVETKFESSFAGNVAIPRAQLEYANLVRALLKQIYSDPVFAASIKP
jgi:hypothetical protein